jgi:hypothetical protein
MMPQSFTHRHAPVEEARKFAGHSLDDQFEAFRTNRFVAMPIAGTIMWTLIGLAGTFLSTTYAVWALYLGTGMIFFVGIAVGRLTGEDVLGKAGKSDCFDQQFLLSVGMALLVFSIAIPFAQVDVTSLPLSLGILSGLMWVPFSGLIQHWVGLFHGITRTVLILGVWYAFPDHRFTAVPAAIVAVYLASIFILETRARKLGITATT